METLIGLLVAAPLLGAGILLTGGRRFDRVGHWLGTLFALASFATFLSGTPESRS